MTCALTESRRGARSRVPRLGAGCTLGVVGLSLALGGMPALAPWLEYDRGALATGQVWRLLGAHLVHYSASHLAWNALGFGVLGAIAERGDRRRTVSVAVLSALATTAGLWLAAPELASYRGLSGVTSALFGLLAARLVREQLRAGDRRGALVSTALGIGFVAVLARTWIAGRPLLVTGYGEEVAPVPLSHAIGLAIGVLGALDPKEISAMYRRIRSLVPVATLVTVAALAAAQARAEGLQRIHSRGSAPVVVHVEGPAVIHVSPAPAAAPFRTDDVWGVPLAPRCSYPCTPARPAHVGVLPTTVVQASRSYDATAQAFDPIVDPLLDATANAVGTAAGTAIGIGLYPPIKVLEHVIGTGTH